MKESYKFICRRPVEPRQQPHLPRAARPPTHPPAPTPRHATPTHPAPGGACYPPASRTGPGTAGTRAPRERPEQDEGAPRSTAGSRARRRSRRGGPGGGRYVRAGEARRAGPGRAPPGRSCRGPSRRPGSSRGAGTCAARRRGGGAAEERGPCRCRVDSARNGRPRATQMTHRGLHRRAGSLRTDSPGNAGQLGVGGGGWGRRRTS